MPLKLKIKVYKLVVRPIFLYGAETWALRKKEEGVLDRTEMRMVRWIAGISLMGRRKSQDIRMCGICNIKKEREVRLRYFGHVTRREENEQTKRTKDMPVRRRRSVGRQRIRSMDVVRTDLGDLGLREVDVLDRNKGRKKTRAADPAIQWD